MFRHPKMNMMFPNALEGVKKIFLAEILVLIGAGCSLIGGLVGGVGVIGGSLAAAGGGALFVVAGAVLAILALIFNLIGLNRASKDESKFRTAFLCTLISLIITVLFSIIGAVAGGPWSTIATIITTALSIVVLVHVFGGIANLAGKLNREDVPRFGKGVMVLQIVVNGITILSNIVSLIGLSNISMLSFVGVLSTLSGIAAIVAYILYLVYLSRAKNMLEA